MSATAIRAQWAHDVRSTLFLGLVLRNTIHVDGAVDWDWDRDWTGSIRYVRC